MKAISFKKTCSMLLILTFLMTIFSANIFAVENTTTMDSDLPELTFTDLPNTHWSYPYVQYMVSKEIINGYPDNTFRPDAPFSRAAFAKLLALSFDLNTYTGNETIILDVLPSHWAYSYVMSGSSYLTFYDNGDGNKYFYPDNPSEREDVAVAMVRAMELNLDDANLSVLDNYMDSGEISPQLIPYVALAIEYGVMQGSGGYFRPGDTLTRAEACTLFARFIQNIKDTYKPDKSVGLGTSDVIDENIPVDPDTAPRIGGYWNLVSITNQMPTGLYEYNVKGQDNYGYQNFTNHMDYDAGTWIVTSEYVNERIKYDEVYKIYKVYEEYFYSNALWSLPRNYYAPNSTITLELSTEINRFERYETNYRWTTLYATLLPGDNWYKDVPAADRANMVDVYGKFSAEATVKDGIIDVKLDTVKVSNSFGAGTDGQRMSLIVGYYPPAGQITGSVIYIYEYIE